MKKLMSMMMALVLVLGLAACGSDGGSKEAPDLQAYYDDFMTSLGDNAPMMLEVTDELVDGLYPGLGDVELNQKVLMTAAISAVAYEMALVECADAGDVETVKGIFQARIDSQVNGGAMYPATIEAWQNAEILVNGNVVALIAAGEDQAAAVEAFNALF